MESKLISAFPAPAIQSSTMSLSLGCTVALLIRSRHERVYHQHTVC